MITKFTDLEAWKEAHTLTILIYSLVKEFPKEEIYGLTSQIKRAVVSIESCIAEGFSRYHYKDRLNFYFDARGSLAEVECQTILACDLKYITKNDLNRVLAQLEKVSVILGGLIRSTQNLSKK